MNTGRIREHLQRGMESEHRTEGKGEGKEEEGETGRKGIYKEWAKERKEDGEEGKEKERKEEKEIYTGGKEREGIHIE